MRRFFRKIRSYEKFLRKNAAKNREEISFPLFSGWGRNKDFWPEYWPLLMIPYGLSEPDFENLLFRKFSGTYIAFFCKIPKNGQMFSKKWKFQNLALRGYKVKILVQNQNEGYGTYQWWHFFRTIWFSGHFLAIFPINSQKYAKQCDVRGVIIRPPVNIFHFCTCSWTPIFQILRYVKQRKISNFDPVVPF